MGATSAIAAFVASAAPCGGAEAHRLAGEAIADLLACMISGWDDPATETAWRALAIERSASGATVVGRGLGPSAAEAALVNGVAAHALDFDDNFGPMFGHASAVLVPALLALGETRDASIARFVESYVAGLEVMAALGDRLTVRHYEHGWHATSTIGVVGAAAASARLLALDPLRAGHAIAIATSMAAGSKVQFGTMTKPLHVGLAARGGLQAALLAEAGMTASPEAIDGAWGFIRLYAGRDGGDESRAIAATLESVRAGETSAAIERHGLKLKLHPNCASAHAAMDVLGDLQRAHGFARDDVAAVDVRVREVSLRNLMYDAPEDGAQARFSMPYAIAATLLGDGRSSLADFTAAAVARPEISVLMPRITTRALEPGSPLRDPALAGEPAEVTVTLASGATVRGARRVQRGGLAEPMSPAERRAKIDDCLRGTPFAPEVERIQAVLADIAGCEDVARLAAILRPAASAGRHTG